MEASLDERKSVVDVLMQNAIISQPDEAQPDVFRVVVPGAIREENVVKAANAEEAVAKVSQVLKVKEASRIVSQDRINTRSPEEQASLNAKSMANEIEERPEEGPVLQSPAGEGSVVINPQNAKISQGATESTS